MANTGQLIFGDLPKVPALWMFGLLGFIALWWYASRSWSGARRAFLVLWLPSAVIAGAIYSLDGRGYTVTQSLRLLVRRDPALLGLAHWIPADGFHVTYAVIVGGAVAALASMALQFFGVVVGALLSVVAPRLNLPRRGLPGRS